MSITHFHAPDTVTKKNSVGILYIEGAEDIDGSLRWFIGPDNITRVEKRVDGVWNATELQLAGNSLFLGRDVSLSAIGHHLLTTSTAENIKSIIVSAEFTDAEGSKQPHIEVFSPRVNRFLFQPDLSVETTLATHTLQALPTTDVLSYANYVKVGNVAPTDSIEIIYTVGSPPRVIYSRLYPASQFPANTEVRFETLAGVSFIDGELITLTLKSASAFSLLGSAVPGPWLAVDFQTFTAEALVTENLVYDNSLNLVLDSSLSPVYSNQF